MATAVESTGNGVTDTTADAVAAQATAAAAAAAVVASRPKRVRTEWLTVRAGCLTCRERHLKCDESLPNCQNCRKSSRACRRGVRLNFIDTQVQSPPIVPPTHDWSVHFQDESREIASEYKGGLGRYAAIPERSPSLPKRETSYGYGPTTTAATVHTQPLPPIQPYPDPPPNSISHALMEPPRDNHHSHSNSDSSYTIPAPPHSAYSNPEQNLTTPDETRGYLNSPEEVLFMQVFVEEVGLWMDSMDPMKHFSRILPFHSLGEPMLLNAFLACGARHLTLVNPAFHEDKALHYYDSATTELLKTLQNPERDTVICATAAVILNVYEVMSERALQRMYHIAGARALIKECGWSARSTGIGAACFWLNVGMEVLSCLRFNWQVAWDPDEWGVDMDFSRETEAGREEIWTYRIVYISAKIANFRASIPRFQEPSARDESIRLGNRVNDWKRLKDWCDSWNMNIPRTMHPMAYLYPHQTSSKSAFPEVWLIKRTTIVARLFYHTAMCLLSQMHPLVSRDADDEELHEMRVSHSHQICGLVAHVKDRGVASVALRSLAIAAECLVVRQEQEEVLQILAKIRKETGWRVEFMQKELREKWGWNNEEAIAQQQQQQQQAQQAQQAAQAQQREQQQREQQQAQQREQQRQQNYLQPGPTLASFAQFAPPSAASATAPSQSQTNPASSSTLPPAPPVQRRMGFTNPLITADFSSQDPPYSAYYVAPSQPQHQQSQHQNNHFNF
ncbi:MAG: Cell morphogenesis protein PAG1 [Chaenotheca gracillima]|nr:MAG: Cell morphogenesis protein PAG1 [Chaenotheca gracillima]